MKSWKDWYVELATPGLRRPMSSWERSRVSSARERLIHAQPRPSLASQLEPQVGWKGLRSWKENYQIKKAWNFMWTKGNRDLLKTIWCCDKRVKGSLPMTKANYEFRRLAYPYNSRYKARLLNCPLFYSQFSMKTYSDSVARTSSFSQDWKNHPRESAYWIRYVCWERVDFYLSKAATKHFLSRKTSLSYICIFWLLLFHVYRKHNCHSRKTV